MPPKAPVTVANQWPHYVSAAAIVIALVAGLLRVVFFDWIDPYHCGSLLTQGTWLDDKFKNWQPEGCMLYKYSSPSATSCLQSKRVIFIGDSVVRQLFFALAHLADSNLPSGPPSSNEKHSDHTYTSSAMTQFEFHWDPFLNSTDTRKLLKGGEASSRSPALFVLGTGLWYLRYSETTGGLSSWEGAIENAISSISLSMPGLADEVVFLPVEQPVFERLSDERRAFIHTPDIDAMNADLAQRIPPPITGSSYFSNSYASSPPPPAPISLPLAFNKMLHPSQTDDGLHFQESTVTMQAQILLNLRCNDALPKVFPMDKTCCRRYPSLSWIQAFVLLCVVGMGPIAHLLTPRFANRAYFPRPEYIKAIATFGMAIALLYLADRTGLWLKEQKQFDVFTFSGLSLLALGVGLGTIKRGDKDLGFLNREQTDELKGWMQLAILIYHYLGASKVSGIYNPIRVLVAAYLFMTGYGHTTFYMKKADFGFLRICQVLIRLNLLTVVLAHTMNTNYLFYYFAPLVSIWFLIIYATFFIGSKFNDRTPLVIGKILMSLALTTAFFSQPFLLEEMFKILSLVFNIRWSASEWAFRVKLDLWIVYSGMLTAIASMKIREQRLTDHPQWQTLQKCGIFASGAAILWFFVFEVSQPFKFVYNRWHPYVSVVPVLAFAVLRNATPVLRSVNSRVFAWVGTCSLETFILQYHFWLAADTQGILLFIPGTAWRPVNFAFSCIVFIWMSHKVAGATGEITTWICDGKKKALPIVAPLAPPGQGRENTTEEVIPLVSNDASVKAGDQESRLASQEGVWADRLTSDSNGAGPGFRMFGGSTEFWSREYALPARMAAIAVSMWVLNLLWPPVPR